ncbi:MAG: cation transporter [Anaerolineae bacterium]|jgi:cation diffusion facilitator family transporter|nr:cation transporter [Anaerolineae bacterium]MBT4309478.1 cation transporter [Anaerolineae bacterium]MBT4459468.1 cation transporter [Anaerolineae bacterium]MBT4842392.1 cation transporter [Anaerolineae bacterium]MBT6060445.1 cation transporter [Anaerolineae bacterium]
MNRSSLTRYAWLSIAAAVTTIALKAGAYFLTGSVGLLSDAIESVVNLLAAIMALSMLTIAARPPDESHTYGHGKAEYFSSNLEGVLVLVAAAGIAVTAVERIFNPREIEQVGIGVVISIIASLINFVVARILLKAGKKHASITLEADGHHLMTDVWTSVGIVLGLGLVALTGWQILDPIIALAVSVNIVYTGIKLIRRSVDGLMDASLLPEEMQAVEDVLDKYRNEYEIDFHALRTRQAGARHFISVHVLVPGAWTVHDAHHIAEDIEGDIRAVVQNSVAFTHLEPIEDEISHDDILLDRS